jgi:hypothetical protein
LLAAALLTGYIFFEYRADSTGRGGLFTKPDTPTGFIYPSDCQAAMGKAQALVATPTPTGPGPFPPAKSFFGCYQTQ